MASNEILTLQNLIFILFASLILLTMFVNLYIVNHHFNCFYMYSSVALSTLHWCATITTTPLQNFLIISHWNAINHSSPFSLPHSSWQPLFCFLWIWLFRYFMKVETYNICPFVPGVFHLGYLHGSSMLQHVWEFPLL